MCEITKRDGTDCTRASAFHVHIKGTETWPAPNGPDYPSSRGQARGTDGRGAFGYTSGRSVTACNGHLPTAVRQLTAYRYTTDGFTYGEFRASASDLVTVSSYSAIPYLRP